MDEQDIELAKDAANFCALKGDPSHAAAIRRVLAALAAPRPQQMRGTSHDVVRVIRATRDDDEAADLVYRYGLGFEQAPRPSGEREAPASLVALVRKYQKWRTAYNRNLDDLSFQRMHEALDAIITWRPSPPGERPAIEVGDWVLLATRYETDSLYILSGLNTVSSEVEADNFNQRGYWYRALPNQADPDILEIRKANGVVWRRRS